MEGGKSIINKRLRLLPGVNGLTKEILEQNVNLKFMLGEYIYMIIIKIIKVKNNERID